MRLLVISRVLWTCAVQSIASVYLFYDEKTIPRLVLYDVCALCLWPACVGSAVGCPELTSSPDDRLVLQFMHEKGLYESPEEFQHRVDVLQLLVELVPKWVRAVARHIGMSEADIAEATGAIYSYGSFRLGTHGPGAPRRLCAV
jgi:hypothetical protein